MKFKRVIFVLCIVVAGILFYAGQFKSPKYLSRYNTMLACDYTLSNQSTPLEIVKRAITNLGNLRDKDILHKLLTNLPHLQKKIKDGAIVYVSSNDFEEYCKELVLNGDKKVILVVKGDQTFPDEYSCVNKIEEFINSENLLHMFVQNNNYQGQSKKISSFPVGIAHPKKYKFPFPARSFDKKIDKILSSLKPTNQRSLRPLCDFHFANSSARHLNELGEDRSAIAKILEKNQACDFLEIRIPQLDLYKAKGERAFDVSPIGNGFDCYRTWESLMLGCIVIVKSSFLNPLFEGLPVVIVDDWSQVTEENLTKWLLEYGDVFHDENVRKKITHQYWMEKVRAVQREFRVATNA